MFPLVAFRNLSGDTHQVWQLLQDTVWRHWIVDIRPNSEQLLVELLLTLGVLGNIICIRDHDPSRSVQASAKDRDRLVEEELRIRPLGRKVFQKLAEDDRNRSVSDFALLELDEKILDVALGHATHAGDTSYSLVRERERDCRHEKGVLTDTGHDLAENMRWNGLRERNEEPEVLHVPEAVHGVVESIHEGIVVRIALEETGKVSIGIQALGGDTHS